MSNVGKASALKKDVLCVSLRPDNSHHQKSIRNNKAILKEEVKAIPIVKQRNRDIERRSKAEACREITKSLPLDYTALLCDTLTVDDNINSSYIAAPKNESCNGVSEDMTDSVPTDSYSVNTFCAQPFTISSGTDNSAAFSSFDSRIVNAPTMSMDMSNIKNVSELSGGLYGCGLSEITAVSASNNEQCGKEPSVSGNNEISPYNPPSNELFSSDMYMSYNNINETNSNNLSISSKNWSQPIPEASANISEGTNNFWLSSKCVHADLKEQNIPDILKRTFCPSEDNEFQPNKTVILNNSIYSEYSDAEAGSEPSDVEGELINFEKFSSEMHQNRYGKKSPQNSYKNPYMASYDKSDYVVIDLSK